MPTIRENSIQGEPKISPMQFDYRLLTVVLFSFLFLFSLTSGGYMENDYSFYVEVLEQISKGKIPYMDYWSSYPPLFMYYIYLVGYSVYFLALVFLGSDTLVSIPVIAPVFVIVLRSLNSVFAALTFYYSCKLLESKKVRDLSWTIYFFLMPFTILTAIWWQDYSILFFIVLALYKYSKEEYLSGSLLFGVSIALKIWPIFLFPIIYVYLQRKLGFKNSAKNFVAMASPGLASILPSILFHPDLFMSMMTYNSSRGPWETVWALLEGYTGHGGGLHLVNITLPHGTESISLYNESNPIFVAVALNQYLLYAVIITFSIILALYHSASDEFTLEKKIALESAIVFLFFKGFSPQFALYITILSMIGFREKVLKPMFLFQLSEVAEFIGVFYIPPELFPKTTATIICTSLVSAAIALRTITLLYATTFMAKQLAKTHEISYLAKKPEPSIKTNIGRILNTLKSTHVKNISIILIILTATFPALHTLTIESHEPKLSLTNADNVYVAKENGLTIFRIDTTKANISEYLNATLCTFKNIEEHLVITYKVSIEPNSTNWDLKEFKLYFTGPLGDKLEIDATKQTEEKQSTIHIYTDIEGGNITLGALIKATKIKTIEIQLIKTATFSRNKTVENTAKIYFYAITLSIATTIIQPLYAGKHKKTKKPVRRKTI